MPLRRLHPSTVVTALALALALGGCSTRTVSSGGAGTGSRELVAVVPAMSVERFLQAVNARDLEAMAGLFGTVDGPVQGERVNVELRMNTIAEILRHEDYRIISEERAPGRETVTRRIGVDLTINGRRIQDVAFMVVQARDGRWMVQEIDLEKVTG